MAALEASAEAETAALAKRRLAGLLGKRLRFTLSDERVVVGVFQCVDRLSNFIVKDAVETRRFSLPDGASEERRRQLGAVLVPGKHLARVEALAGDAADALNPPLGTMDGGFTLTGVSLALPPMTPTK